MERTATGEVANLKLDLLWGEDIYCAVFCTWQMMVADPRVSEGCFGVDYEGSLIVTNYRVAFKAVSSDSDETSSTTAPSLDSGSRQFLPSLIQDQTENFEWDLPLFAIQNYESNPHTFVDGACSFLNDGPRVTIRFIGKNGQSINVLCEDCPATFRLLRLVNDKAFGSQASDAFAFAYGQKRLSNPPKLPPRKFSAPLSPSSPTHLELEFKTEGPFEIEANVSVPPLPLRARNGWDLYNPVAEYKRLGFIRELGHNDRLSGPVGWRLVNQILEGRNKFWVCKTYPRYFVVPACVTDAQMLVVREFRSKNRIPVAVWKHPTNHATLSRSSQPLVGVKGNRNYEDEKLVQLLAGAGGNQTMMSENKFHIIDARSQQAVMGNMALGKGGEKAEYYRGAQIHHMKLENIHYIRDALTKLQAVCGPHSSSLSVVDTKWLSIMRKLLSASVTVVRYLEYQGQSVLVHCSDGWDRTCQITSLAQLLLDSHYRTLRGFSILIEKEWCSFGHQFGLRCSHGTSSNNERSPVFLLWCDCVFQIIRQYPTAFEFNEEFLIGLMDQLYACRYGTFLFNSEEERLASSSFSRTRSVWEIVQDFNLQSFRNAEFVPCQQTLWPRHEPKFLVLWEKYHLRWDYTSKIGKPSRTYY